MRTLLISTDFDETWQPIRRKAFLYGAGSHLILHSLEAEQQFCKVKDDSLENKTCLTCGNCTLTCGINLSLLLLVSQYRFYTWNMFETRISTTILVFLGPASVDYKLAKRLAGNTRLSCDVRRQPQRWFAGLLFFKSKSYFYLEPIQQHRWKKSVVWCSWQGGWEHQTFEKIDIGF